MESWKMGRDSIGDSGLGNSVVSTERPNVRYHHNKPAKKRRGKYVNGKAYLKCLYSNATSLVNKWDYFNSLIQTSEFPHLLMITETWFNSKSLKNIPHYSLFNKDREQVVGGGVAIYVRDDLEASEVSEDGLVQTTGEEIWCKVKTGVDSILIGCIYRPPYSNHETAEEIFNNIALAKKLVENKKYTGLLIAGDFNFPKINWSSLHGYVEGQSQAGVLSSKFVETLEENFLAQHVQVPTFGEKTLDLVITDNPNRIYVVQAGAPLGSTSKNRLHSVLNWEYLLEEKPTPKLVSKILYNKGNYVGLEEHLASKIENMSGLEVNCMFNTLITVYQEGVANFIPKLTLSEKNISTRKNPKWFNKNIKKLTNSKYKWYIRTQIDRSDSTEATYKGVCRQVEKEVKKARKKYEWSIISNCKNEPKRIFSYVNDQRINKDRVRSLNDGFGNLVTDKLIISNIFNKKFQTAFSRDDGRPLPTMEKRTNCVCKIDLSVFSASNILKYLLNLDVHKAPGVDGMHPSVLKNCASIFAVCLSRLFIVSYTSGIVPNAWKESNISPIFKKGTRTEALNYRPVSLTSIACKIKERI